VHGRLPAHPQWQDATFMPDVALSGGERIALHDGATLRVVHTPGHASNHLCYVLEEEKTLFAGDHVMQLSTVVINPPDGDMAAYVASLRALMAEDLDWIAPGHGFLMAEPARAMAAIVAHRLRREQKVLAALRADAAAPVEALLERVYDDVPPRLHAMALRSLQAHLLKLAAEGRAVVSAQGWRLEGTVPDA
jgi:glyoxylase-like metal-dependent hydrolase (beta-lactamase superfamily II)